MDVAETGFRNDRVAIDELPDFSQVELEPVVPGYTRYSVATHGGFGFGAAIIAGVVVAFAADLRVGLAVGALAALVIGVPLTVYGLLDARVFGWALREHDVLTRSGVVWRKSVVLPLVRIQHVELSSGPLERVYGTRRVQAYSAGSGTADLVIYGLEPDRAEQVRAYLLERIDQRMGEHGHG